MNTLIIISILIVSVQLGAAHVPHERHARDIGHFEMPPMCRDQRFCFIQRPDYPTEKVETLLKKMALRSSSLSPTTTERCGDDKGLCKSHETIVASLYYIQDEQGRIRTVVQAENFKQIVPITECRSEREPRIEYFMNSTLDRYNVTCLQKTIDFKFLVLSLDEKSFEVVSMIGGVPTCCLCHLQLK